METQHAPHGASPEVRRYLQMVQALKEIRDRRRAMMKTAIQAEPNRGNPYDDRWLPRVKGTAKR